jgi:hypothetical protein
MRSGDSRRKGKFASAKVKKNLWIKHVSYTKRNCVCTSYRLVSWFIPFDFVDWSQEERKMTALV